VAGAGQGVAVPRIGGLPLRSYARLRCRARRGEILGNPVGSAYRVSDVMEFMRRASLGDADVKDPALFDWQGGGPDVWE
jgi:hypothetical protein